MRQWKWLAILGVLLITTIGLLSVPPKTVSASAIDINADRSALTGDHSISCQQISVFVQIEHQNEQILMKSYNVQMMQLHNF